MWLLLAACSPAPTDSGPTVAPIDLRLFLPGVVATADLPAGHVIGPDDLRVGAVPDFTPEPVPDPAPWIGAVVREPILSGEPFRGERTAPGDGWTALVETGTAVALAIPRWAAVGLGPGCVVEVVQADDPGRRPRLAHPDPVRVLGFEPDEGKGGPVTVVVEAGGAVAPGPLTLVVLQRSAEADNPVSPVFVPTERPGRKVAVARHPLLPGVFVRSADLAEVGGVGLVGLDLPEVWALTPHQRILPGELVRAERLATDTTGLCVKIPDGLRAVGVPAAPGTVGPDLVDGRVTIRARGHELRDLYVLAVSGDVVTVAARPDVARAIAVVAATAGEPFTVGP